MKRSKTRHSPNQPYYIGAELLIDKSKEGMDGVDAKLVKFGGKGKQAQNWLKSFPPLNTPDGSEIKRVVLRLPIGYRERKDVIALYKKKGLTHENARFQMLSEHAGPGNTLVYVRSTAEPSGGDSSQQLVTESQPAEEPVDITISDLVGDSDQPSGEATEGEDLVIGQD